MFCKKVKKYIGAYLGMMNGADAICFSAGIGENSPEVRREVCSNLEWFGIELDDEKNLEAIGGKEMMISKDSSRVKIYVIPTNEELVLARDTARVILNDIK
jgi:acetate kinase